MSGESTSVSFKPKTSLPSTVDIQVGPAECVATFVLVSSVRSAIGAVNAHAH